jgi:hypothetical protein
MITRLAIVSDAFILVAAGPMIFTHFNVVQNIIQFRVERLVRVVLFLE